MIQITNPKRLITFIIAILAILIIAILIITKLIWGSTEIKKSGDFAIEQGQSANIVWQALKEEGYTRGTTPWKYFGRKYDAEEKIQAGTYRLEKGEKVQDVVKRFTTGDVTPDELTITYPEGFTLKQIAKRTSARGIGTEPEFIQEAKPKNYTEDFPFLKEIQANRDLEGYLFPDTYRVFPDDTPKDVITRMLIAFDTNLTEELQTEAKTNNRTLDEIVIMASIIEREVINTEDMSMISGVLWKRFDENIGLAVDATTRYALDKWDDPLTYQDLQTDSPYNTRKYRGLPPTPISNPGARAIIAAVRPKASPYYYYLSTPEGETIFSKTNDEHNVNKAKYLK